MVNASKSKEGNSYYVTFGFTFQEVVDAGLFDELNRTWNTSKKPSEYLNLIQRLILAQRQAQQPQQQNPFYNQQRPFSQEDLRSAFRDKMGQDPNDFFNQTYGGNWGKEPLGHQSRIKPEPAWCKVLGLPRTATKDEIKSKYLSLAKKAHPDAGGDPAEFRKISEAYEEAMR